MKHWLYSFVFMACLLSARGQVTMEITLDQDLFLRSESLPVRVRITNNSGRTLQLSDSGWLTFSVEARETAGGLNKKTVHFGKPVTLESARTATLETDLMPHFNLAEPGRYTLTAQARITQLEMNIDAKPRSFDIVTGTKLWEREFGVPAKVPPVTRKFALQQATFLKQLRLYLRLTDSNESKVFTVFPLGPLVSFSKPEALLDQSSNLHVLFQTGARSFTYSVISPDGDLIIRQSYDYSATRPTIRPDDGGRVEVVGGQRRPVLSDLPPPRPIPLTNDVSLTK